MRCTGKKENVSLRLEENDQGSCPAFDCGRSLVGGCIGVGRWLSTLGKVMPAGRGRRGRRTGCRDSFFGGKPCEQSLDDALFFDFEAVQLANHAASGPYGMEGGGEDLIFGCVGALAVCFPGVVVVGAVGGEDGFSDQIRQGRRPADAD